MSGRLRLVLAGSLNGAVGLLRITARGFRLIRRVRMILGLEVFSLGCAFAAASHRYLQSQ
jgi:hypothetical protein